MPFFHSIKAKNLLSFGPDGMELELKPLNVLIGPNGSGKSNFLDLFDLLRSCPNSLTAGMRQNGGFDLFWKGDSDGIAELTATTKEIRPSLPDIELHHRIDFTCQGNALFLCGEKITNHSGIDNVSSIIPLFHTASTSRGNIGLLSPNENGDVEIKDYSQGESALSQVKDADRFSELTALGRFYEAIHLYCNWHFGRHNNPVRQPQPTDLPKHSLMSDGSNYALILNKFESVPKAKEQLLTQLRKLYEGLEGYHIDIFGNYCQVIFHESGGRQIPATRLSDGTLRYLFLLLILLDPTPPPVICIEEPELGLHPDLMHTLADLLKEASERTQLIVTTHSDILIDALSDTPESVVVCEKHDGCTTMKRLDAGELKVWLEKYGLGQLWLEGEIGGTRW